MTWTQRMFEALTLEIIGIMRRPVSIFRHERFKRLVRAQDYLVKRTTTRPEQLVSP